MKKHEPGSSIDYNVLNLDDARKICGRFHYAVVNVATNRPLWLCESGENAREIVKEYQSYYFIPLKIVDLRKWK